MTDHQRAKVLDLVNKLVVEVAALACSRLESHAGYSVAEEIGTIIMRSVQVGHRPNCPQQDADIYNAYLELREAVSCMGDRQDHRAQERQTDDRQDHHQLAPRHDTPKRQAAPHIR